MSEPIHTVRERAGLDLQVGDRVWLDELEHMYSDGGHFATVESVTPYEERYTSGVDVKFIGRDSNGRDRERRYVAGLGADHIHLVLVA